MGGIDRPGTRRISGIRKVNGREGDGGKTLMAWLRELSRFVVLVRLVGRLLAKRGRWWGDERACLRRADREKPARVANTLEKRHDDDKQKKRD